MNNQIIFERFWGIYSLVKWIFIILEILILIFFVFAFYKAWKFRPSLGPKKRKRVPTIHREVYRARWFEILIKLESEDEKQLKLALIEADKLVDDILKDIGIKGKHLADKLSKIHPEGLESLNDLLEAHRTRNDLLSVPDFALSKEEITETLKLYENFLKEIGVIIE